MEIRAELEHAKRVHLVQDAELFHDRKIARQQRFADVKARMMILLELNTLPRRCSKAAAVDPDGPPPTTSTSQSKACSASLMRSSLQRRQANAMLQSPRIQRRRNRPRVPPVSATLPIPPPLSNPARRPRGAAIALIAYLAVLLLALASGLVWLEDIAALLLATLLLWPGLRGRSIVAGVLWATAALGILALSMSGRGRLALDFMPVMVNAALCHLFARTLAKGRQPLIARLIAVSKVRSALNFRAWKITRVR